LRRVRAELASFAASARRFTRSVSPDGTGIDEEGIEERKVTNVLRERDGGTTTIEFLAEGSVTAYFPSPLRDADSTLSLGGEELTLTLLSSDPLASDPDEEIESGQWGIAGEPMSAERVRKMASGQ
jgi:hypothetical protein